MKGKLTKYNSFEEMKASQKGVKLSKKQLAKREKEWKELYDLIHKNATIEHLSDKESK